MKAIVKMTNNAPAKTELPWPAKIKLRLPVTVIELLIILADMFSAIFSDEDASAELSLTGAARDIIDWISFSKLFIGILYQLTLVLFSSALRSL